MWQRKTKSVMEEKKYTYSSRNYKSKKKRILLLFLGVAILGVFITVFVYFFTRPSEDEKSNTEKTEKYSKSEFSKKIDSKTIKAIRRHLDNYCKFLFDENFDASYYFADKVEQFITMKNTTSDAITSYIRNSYQNEFQNGNYYIENKLFSVSSTEGGNYEALFIEKGRCFRKSKNKTQYTRVKVKAIFNSDLKIINWQEIEILENRFE